MSVVREIELSLVPPSIILFLSETVIADCAQVKVVQLGQLLIQDRDEDSGIEEDLNGGEKDTEYLELEKESENTSLVVILLCALLRRHDADLQWSLV